MTPEEEIKEVKKELDSVKKVVEEVQETVKEILTFLKGNAIDKAGFVDDFKELLIAHGELKSRVTQIEIFIDRAKLALLVSGFLLIALKLGVFEVIKMFLK